MAEKSNPTNADLLREIRAMNQRLAALENWKLISDAAKEAIDKYKQEEERSRQSKLQDKAAKGKIDVLKQITLFLAAATALIYVVVQGRAQ